VTLNSQKRDEQLKQRKLEKLDELKILKWSNVLTPLNSISQLGRRGVFKPKIAKRVHFKGNVFSQKFCSVFGRDRKRARF
jgi:hypothetical protein